MKALVFSAPNEMKLTDMPRPELQAGEALIRVQYIGICGTDVHVFRGHHATAVYPLIPGHEFVGELVEIKGEGADAFQIGDRVVAQEILTCGHCDACARGEDNVCEDLKIIGVHADGGFAEYVRVKTRKMYRVPKDVDLKRAALIEPLAVAIHDVRMSGLKVSETALIIGGGPIGILVGCVAKQAGARRVIVSEVVESRRKIAEELGLLTINPLEPGFDEKLTQLNKGENFDVSFEAAGIPSGITTCVEHTKNTGSIVQIGITKGPYPVDTGKIFAKELRLQGVRIHNQFAFKSAVNAVADGLMDQVLDKVASAVYDFNDIEKAFDCAENNKDALKVLVKIAD
ncbi:MAG: alcohol dehydrogenase catalytic domain-containing protein [Clostridiales bacterium]|nr:alcohol dehydrogenase catalytic domain-containing protein [Clostridiales bacterium]